MSTVQIIGRSSSHFTRVARIVAHELGVPVELVPIHDMKRLDASAYAENPALKMPTLKRGESQVFGTENICRAMVEIAGSPKRIVWPEELTRDVSRNAQEMVWHAMAAQVQMVVGLVIGKLPADNIYFSKGRTGFQGALQWLETHLAEALAALPSPRDLSLFEVTLFCLLDHVRFRPSVPLDPYPALSLFADDFAKRPSALATPYQLDARPPA